MDKNLDADIAKTLDRLKIFANKNNPLQAISPFYHAADTLLKYGQVEKNTQKKQHYFQQFYAQFEKFAMSDFSKLKKHHQQILDQIAQIIQSQTFIECLRPDLHNIRHLRNSLKIQKKQNLFDTPVKKISHERSSEDSFVSQKKSSTSQQKEQSQGNSENKLDSLFKSIQKSYEDHCLDDAFLKTQEYLSSITNLSEISPQRSNFLKNISDQYETMTNFYSQFDQGEWILDKQQKGITLEYKIDEVQNMIAIRILGEGDIAIQPFLAIISQIDLMGQYVPFCYDCVQMKKISRNQRIGTSKIYIPLLKDRQTYFYAAGYDRFKSHKSLFFFSKTINDDLIYQKKYDFKVPKEGKYVRLEYKFFIVQYIPITAKKAKIRLASKIDMKMDFVPKFIIFKSARIFAFDYFKNIIDRIKNFKGSQWEKKIEKNPNMYKFFRKKCDEFTFK